MFQIIVIFVIIVLVLILICRYLWLKNYVLRKQVQEVISKKQSQSVRYGKMTEQFLPFIEAYPYNEQNFRFLGTPIDGIQFESNRIIFTEFKAADSRLSPKQKQIKELIENKKVYFEEFNLR